MTTSKPAVRTVRLAALRQTVAWLERAMPKGQQEQDEVYRLILELRRAMNPPKQEN
jgi:hypothetical protein